MMWQGGGLLYDLSKRAMLTGNYSELDEAIRSKIRPYLYNNGDGSWIHCAHLACLRNRDGGGTMAHAQNDVSAEQGWRINWRMRRLILSAQQG